MHRPTAQPMIRLASRLGVVLLAALFVGGCGGGDGESEAGDDPTSSPAGEESPDCSEGSDAARAAEVIAGPVEPGEHQTAQLGTAVTFTSDETWEVPASKPGFLALLSPDAPEPRTREIHLLRNAEMLAGPDPGLTDEGETDVQLDAFLETASDLETEGAGETRVGGAAAEVADLRVQQERLLFATEAFPLYLQPDQAARLWLIEQAEGNPIAVLANTMEQDADWLDTTATALVDTIALGDPVDLDIAAATTCQTRAQFD